MLSFYTKQQEIEPIEMIPMQRCAVIPAETRLGKANAFEVATPYGRYSLAATSKDEMNTWIKAIKGAVKRVGIKVCLVGASGVGKTSFLRRWIRDDWEPHQARGDEHCFFKKDTRFGGWLCKLGIWDLAGRPSLHELAPICFIGPNKDEPTHAAILTYSITDKESFDQLKMWYDEIKEACPSCVFVVAATKSDLSGPKRKVTAKDGKAFADSISATFIETSALTGEGVVAAFDQFLRVMHDNDLFVTYPMQVMGV